MDKALRDEETTQFINKFTTCVIRYRVTGVGTARGSDAGGTSTKLFLVSLKNPGVTARPTPRRCMMSKTAELPVCCNEQQATVSSQFFEHSPIFNFMLESAAFAKVVTIRCKNTIRN